MRLNIPATPSSNVFVMTFNLQSRLKLYHPPSIYPHITAMEQDEDEFLYGDAVAAPPVVALQQASAVATPTPAPASASVTPSDVVPGLPGLGGGVDTPMGESDSGNAGVGGEESLEEGEEEEEEVEVEDSDDDIEFVIERKDGSRPEAPPQPSRYNQVRMAPSRPTPDTTKPPTAPSGPSGSRTTPQPQSAPSVPSAPGQLHPPTSTSKLDLNANPSYNGAPIKSISLDSDTLLPADKPWRKPGADVTDYFNYGFDEFTWTAYCQKQESLRDEYDPHKLMEQMMMLSGMGIGIPGMDPTAGMPDMSTMMNFGPGGGGVVAPSGPAGGGGDMGMGGMGDPTGMYGGAGMGGFDERAQQGAYGMPQGGDPRRGGMYDPNSEQAFEPAVDFNGYRPPQGPGGGMGAYGGYDGGMMQQQQQQQRGPGGYGPTGPRGGRGGRRGW